MKDQVVKSCLLVDDDPDDQELLMFEVQNVCCKTICYTVSNGEEALHLLLQDGLRPDFIFTDLQMPRMDGFQLISELKRHPELRDIPVLAMSSLYSEQYLAKLKELGVTGFHYKQNAKTLCDVVQKFLHGPIQGTGNGKDKGRGGSASIL